MASNKRTIYLGLDYKDFTGGVTEVNRKMGLLDAEFKLAQERAKNYGSETDTLGTKIDYLQSKIALQTQKVEAAKRAYDEAMSSQNASQKTIDALDKKLLQERTTLEKLNGELKETTEQEKKADVAADSFGNSIRNVASSLGLNVNPAVEALASKFDGVNKYAGIATIGIGALIGKLVSASSTFAEYSDNILTMSSVTGIATDELQKFEYASELVDVSTDTLATSLRKLVSNMSKAKDGSTESIEAFQSLGIRIKDSSGHLRDSNDVFYEAIDALGRMKNETERDAAAMKIFGKSATELNPLIEAGSSRLRQLGDEAEATGKILNDEELAEGGAYKDALDKLHNAGNKLNVSLGKVLAPILTQIAEIISSMDPNVLKVIILMTSATSIAVTLSKAYLGMAGAATTAAAAQGALGATAGKSLGPLLAIAAIVIVIVVLFAMLSGSAKDADKALKDAEETTKKMGNTISEAQESANRTQRHASGTTNFGGGKTWVGEEGPELVSLPAGSSITPAGQLGGVGESNTFYVTIDAKNVDDFNRVVELAKSQKSAVRRI